MIELLTDTGTLTATAVFFLKGGKNSTGRPQIGVGRYKYRISRLIAAALENLKTLDNRWDVCRNPECVSPDIACSVAEFEREMMLERQREGFANVVRMLLSPRRFEVHEAPMNTLNPLQKQHFYFSRTLIQLFGPFQQKVLDRAKVAFAGALHLVLNTYQKRLET